MPGDLVRAAPGQCRLVVDSPSQISLNRYNGAYVPLKIDGVWKARLIPATPPALSNVGLTAGDLRYIYGFDNGGSFELESSATGHSTDSDFGIEVKTGDPTRTLFGMLRAGAGSPGTFIDSDAQRFLLNWFNRRNLDLVGTFSADRATNSTSFTEIDTEIRMEMLAWADEAIHAGGQGTLLQTTNGQAAGSALGIDSTSVVSAGVGTTFTGFANTWQPFGLYLTKMLTEGYHFVTLLGAVSAGAATWASGDSIGTGPMKSRIWAMTRG